MNAANASDVERRAAVDQVVSAVAWAGFPELHDAIQRWADLAGSEAAGVEVSAVPIGMDWVSVRVSQIQGEDSVSDWLEWLAPTSFSRASQAAIDHFAAREMHTAQNVLKWRAGNWPRNLADLVEPPGPDPLPASSSEVPLAKKSAAPAPKPAESPAPPAPKAAKPQAAKAAAPVTRSKPGPKPGPKPAEPAATSKKEGHRSTGKPRAG